MRRYRRFPLISTVIMGGLVAAVIMLSMYDQNLPHRALDSVGKTLTGLGQSISVMLGGGAADAGGLFVFSSDESDGYAADFANQLPMLVNADHPVPSGYAPQNLVLMTDYCDENIVKIKGSEIEGNQQAVDALMVMLGAAIEQGVEDWQISAGYRSVAYQQQVWDNYVYKYRTENEMSSSQAEAATAKYVAKPGCSEHHTGLAFDVTVPGESFPLTDQSKWLAENCWDYGFIIRYTEEKVSITGINAEPWHIRYVGKNHAIEMRDKNWCLEEYIQAKSEG